MDSKIQAKVDNALASWKEFWGERLKSAYLYGSAARGDWTSKSSDINILLIVEDIDYKRWPEAAELAKRRIKKGFGLPLILSENYIAKSLDVFPIEFLDMKLFHENIFGDDILSDLTIDNKDLRIQAEREIRGKWVQLRQAALERGGETVEMRNLLAMSVPTWVAVFQAILTINEQNVAVEKAEVLRNGAQVAGVNPETFLKLHRLRTEKKSLNRTGAWELITETLGELDKLIIFVDEKIANLD